jgi:hypothetical protein
MKSSALVIVIAVGLGLAVFAGMSVFMYRSCASLADSGDASGVKLGEDIPPYARALFVEHKLLSPGEKPVAFYDVTISLDGTDFFLLTNRRVLHDTAGRVQAIALDRVDSIDHREGGIEGDIIVVRSKDSDYLKVVIAPFNDGESFLEALNAEWKQHDGGGTERAK